MKFKLLNTLLCIILIFVLACEKVNDDINCDITDRCEEVDAGFLQSNWDDYGTQMYGYAGNNYFFNLSDDDSFFMHRLHYNDQLYSECGFQYEWDIYSKGVWEYSDSLLTLSGYYCDEEYNRLTTSPCWQYIDTGSFYMELSNISYCNDTLLLKDNQATNELYYFLKLKKVD